MATVPMEKLGEVSAAYATDPSVRLKEGHSIAAMKKKGLENENKPYPKTVSIQKLKNSKLLTFAGGSTSTPYTNDICLIIVHTSPCHVSN